MRHEVLTLGFFATVVLLALPSRVFAQIVINEVLPNPEGEDKIGEWLELYNPTGQDLDVNGYVLKDAAGNELTIDAIHTDGETILSDGGWLVIHRSGHTTFSLNNDGDEAIQLLSQETVVDTFSYSSSSEGKTWGRIPDGGDISAQELSPTEGSANVLPTPTPEPTDVPEPTQEPTPTKTPTQAPSPTPKPTAKPTTKPAPSPTPKPEVLGESEDEDSSVAATEISLSTQPEAEDKKESQEKTEQEKKVASQYTAPIVISLAGLLLLAGAALPFLRERFRGLRRKNKRNETSEEEI